VTLTRGAPALFETGNSKFEYKVRVLKVVFEESAGRLLTSLAALSRNREREIPIPLHVILNYSVAYPWHFSKSVSARIGVGVRRRRYD
jgi:hypothetical protein